MASTSTSISKSIEDKIKEFEELLKKEAEGEPESLYKLGALYYLGEVTEKNITRAIDLFRRAAAKHYADAQYTLGFCFERGEGVESDMKQAIEYYTLAAEQGNSDAQCCLGRCYYHGLGVKTNIEIGRDWIKKAADQKHMEALFFMGNFYGYGEGVEVDMKKAIEYYTLSAEENADAQFKLGKCFLNGDGVTEDHEIAKSWFTKAAAQKHEDAQYALDHWDDEDALEEDQDERRNLEEVAKAKEELKSLEEQIRASDIKASLIEEDVRLHKSTLTSVGFLQRMKEEKIKKLQEKMAKLKAEMASIKAGIPVQLKTGVGMSTTAETVMSIEILEFLLERETLEHPMLLCGLSAYYLLGKFVEQDFKRAVALLQKSADNNFAHAQYMLGFCYQTGSGVESDISKAIKLYELAAKQGLEQAQIALDKLAEVSMPTRDEPSMTSKLSELIFRLREVPVIRDFPLDVIPLIAEYADDSKPSETETSALASRYKRKSL